MNSARRHTIAIRIASVLFYVTGVGGVISLPVMLAFVMRNRALPEAFGITFLSGPFERRLGLDAVVLLGWVQFALSGLEILAARWLWRSQRKGAWLGLALFPPSLVLWIGFAAPGPLLVGPVRVAAIAIGWRALR